jgi:hypothetical protein
LDVQVNGGSGHGPVGEDEVDGASLAAFEVLSERGAVEGRVHGDELELPALIADLHQVFGLSLGEPAEQLLELVVGVGVVERDAELFLSEGGRQSAQQQAHGFGELEMSGCTEGADGDEGVTVQLGDDAGLGTEAGGEGVGELGASSGVLGAGEESAGIEQRGLEQGVIEARRGVIVLEPELDELAVALCSEGRQRGSGESPLGELAEVEASRLVFFVRLWFFSKSSRTKGQRPSAEP